MAAAPPRQRGAASVTATLALLVLLAVAAPRCHVARAQQEYEANAQDNCTRTDRSVLGYTCNATAAAAPCASYVVFRASSPYDSPVSISYLLNLTPAAVAGANAVPTVPPVAASRLLLAPLPCACAPQGYYQHNASYTIQQSTGEETYFTIANITYQGLSTCQALIAQNPRHDSLSLVKGNNLTVPVRCGCPSPAQAAAGVKHLLVYLVTWGDSVSAIADRFRVDAQAVLDANSIGETDNIYPFTTLLIPLKTAPTADMLVSPAPPPAPAPPQAQPPTPPSSGSSSGVAVGVGVGVGGLALVGLLGLIFFCVRRRRRRRRTLRSGEGENGGRPGKVVHDLPSSSDYDPLASGKHTAGTTNTSSSYSSSALVSSDARAAMEAMTLYKYSDLEKATAGFSEERRIADASVYRAVINGDAAAVKRVAGDVSGEVGILKRVNHSSLVRLSGLCVHHGDTYLVFEYAENGALSDWLHGSAGTLVWKQRVQAAFDVADGLNYLHNYTNPACVHKNLKSSNVLLDADLRAKVSSFALARSVPDNGAGQLTRHVVGTQGYLAPEYLEHGLITPKLDVFAFGVILLELLSGKEATFDGGDKRGETLLWESAEGLVAEGEDARGKVRAFMDPRLQGDYPLDLAVAVASLALRCVAREPKARPSMDDVFVTLSAVYNSTLDWDPSDYGNSRSSIVGR